MRGWDQVSLNQFDAEIHFRLHVHGSQIPNALQRASCQSWFLIGCVSLPQRTMMNSYPMRNSSCCDDPSKISKHLSDFRSTYHISIWSTVDQATWHNFRSAKTQISQILLHLIDSLAWREVQGWTSMRRWCQGGLRETNMPNRSPLQLHKINWKPIKKNKEMDYQLTSEIHNTSPPDDICYSHNACSHGTVCTLIVMQEIWREFTKRLSSQKAYSKNGVKLDFACPLDL